MSLVLGVASVAYAGAVVELVATSANPLNPAGTFDPDEIVTVEVHLRHSVDDVDRLLRHIQFNLEDTHVDLLAGLSLPETHGLATPAVNFWDFSSTTACDGDPAQCGIGHWVDDDRAGGPTGIAIAYHAAVPAPPTVPDDTGPNTDAQLVLPGASASSVRVGVLQIQMPVAAGSYPLDVMNSDAPSAETAARISYGFEASNASWTDLTPVTIWGAGTPDLTGGTLTMTVAPSAGTAKWESVKFYPFIFEVLGPLDIGLEIPGDGSYAEPRINGVSRVTVTFSGPVNRARAENSANVVVTGCNFLTPVDMGPIAITPSLRADDRTLDIVFVPGLPNEAVYDMELVNQQTVGGRDVTDGTTRSFAVLFGDFDPTNQVAAADLAGIRGRINDFTSPSDVDSVRADQNLSGQVTAADIANARSDFNNLAVALCP